MRVQKRAPLFREGRIVFMKPYLDILKLVWPLALGMINNAIMQFVDRAYLAHESMASLEAALPASILAFMVLCFFQSIVAYSGTFIAQYHGAGDEVMCRMSYRAGVAIALVSGVIAALTEPLGERVLARFAPGADVLVRELSYYGIVTFGGVFLLLQMAAASYFTGRGRTRIVFYVNVAGNLVNIAIDPFLIFGWCGAPRLGIAGAAYATVFSMFVQWAVLAWFMRREIRGSDMQKPVPARSEFLPLVMRILRFGVPSGAYSVLNILSFTIFVFITGRIGGVAFAVSNACFAVNYLLFAPMEGFALGAATLVGQAQGRGDSASAHRDAMRTLMLGVGFVALWSLLAVVFYRQILSLFAPDEAVRQEFFSLGRTLFMLMAAWQVFDAADVIISGALKGAGDTKFVLWWMLVVAFGIWLPLVWIVAALHNTMPALWATMIVYVVVICIGSLLRWRNGRWRSIAVV